MIGFKQIFSSEIIADKLNLNDDEKKVIYGLCLTIYEQSDSKNIPSVSNSGGVQSEKNLHMLESFKSLRQFLENYLKSVFIENNIDVTVDMNSLWLNVNPKNSCNHVHTHNNCSYSGILWVSCPEKQGKFHFIDPRTGALQDNFFTSVFSSRVGRNPEEFEFYIFPSWIPHMIDINEDNKPQMCLAFNFDIELQ